MPDTEQQKVLPCCLPQDYEEAVLQLLDGALWEEALRLVRPFQSRDFESFVV